MDLEYKVMVLGNHQVKIRQISPDEEGDEGVKIYEREDEDISKVILHIEVDGYFLIYYHYYPFNTGLHHFTIYVRENIIFIAGQTKSCTINMLTNKVENEFEHTLFWDFDEIREGFILESGEIDCLLRDKNGKIIDKAYVEPPYEMFEECDRIRFEFESIIEGGRTYLNFPQ